MGRESDWGSRPRSPSVEGVPVSEILKLWSRQLSPEVQNKLDQLEEVLRVKRSSGPALAPAPAPVLEALKREGTCQPTSSVASELAAG